MTMYLNPVIIHQKDQRKNMGSVISVSFDPALSGVSGMILCVFARTSWYSRMMIAKACTPN